MKRIGQLVLIAFVICFIVYRISSGSFRHHPLSFPSYSKHTPTAVLPDQPVQYNQPRHDTAILSGGYKILILVPYNHQNNGTFMLLPGWNFPPDDWCRNTSLCEEARKEGYFVVMPDMSKSVYQETIYKETRAEWKNMPTRKWLRDTAIPYLQQKFGLLQKGQRNFLAGLSTGARGVALLTLDLPDLFTAAAALSGDYDQSLLPADPLMTGYYGPFKQFAERWKSTDNIMHRISGFRTPLYLGHGSLDKTCNPAQTQMLFDSILKYHPLLNVKLNMPVAGHNYEYWNSEVGNILSFFRSIE